jgi:uncharacterized protein (DUF58 family)
LDAREVERRLRHLEVTVVRRLDTLLQGNYRGTTFGPGVEPGEGRLYRIGDDVRRMDWKLTARSGAPHVRDAIADRELEIRFVVDRSASLDFGTARYVKREVATGAAAALGFLAARSGSRVGAVLFGNGPLKAYPAKAGRNAVRRILVDMVTQPAAGAPRGPGLAEALRTVQRLARRRGVVIVISDFLVDHRWELPLRGLRSGHDLIAIEVIDPRELELPAVGSMVVSDPETGRQLEVRTSRALRAAYAEQTALHREAVGTALRSVAADHVILRTDSDWIKDVAKFLRRRRLTAWLAVSGSRTIPAASA